MTSPPVNGHGGPPSRVVAIVPALDRADTVGATVQALARVPGVDAVLVVDDGSGDDTAARAAAAGAGVLRLALTGGKGGAVAAGVAATPGAEVYVLVDADVGETASGVAPLVDEVLSGRADVAVGVLPGAGRRGGFGLVRRLAAAGIRRASVYGSVAPLSGQRAVRADLLRSLRDARGFGLEVAMTVDAVRSGARVVELPVDMDHRHTGRTLAGFAHRARQGADVVRALWPRLVSARGRQAAIVAALAGVLALAWWSGARAVPSSLPATGPARSVLIVGVPGLSWDDVGTGRMPALDALLERGALGAMNVRTRSGAPSTAEAYATLGAGARVRAGPEAAAAAGTRPVRVPEAPSVRSEAGRHLSTRPGALGQALHAAGLRTAVVGTADLAPGLTGADDLGRPLRPVAVALMDEGGLVDAGTVEPGELLVADPEAPFGRRADPDAMVSATRAALGGAEVVLVDPGDLDRARSLRELGAPEWFVARAREGALARTDSLLGQLVEASPPGALILVVSVVPPADEWRLAPVVAAGAGVRPGYLMSPSARRLGLVTLTDLAPTVLDALGAPVPAAMAGHPLRYHPGQPDPGRLARLDRDAAYREDVYVAVGVAVALVLAAATGAVAWAGVRTRRGRPVPPRVRPILRDVLVAVAAFPVATFLFRASAVGPALGWWGLAVLVALDLAVVAVARRARRHPLSPLAWVAGATVWLLVADLALGGRLQLASILGYSPQSASRFYGLGNTAFAVLAGATLVAAALHVQHAPRRRDALVAVTGFMALVALVDGVPALGNDVGGLLTLPPVFLLVGLRFWGRPLRARTLAVAAGAALALLAAVTAVDLLRPPATRTHLGQLAADVASEGPGHLGTIVARKAAASAGMLVATPASWLPPAAAAAVLYLLHRRSGWFTGLAPSTPVRVGIVGALAAGALGSVVNDSGVVVIALVLVEVGPLVAWLALAGPERSPRWVVPLAGAATAPPPPNGSGARPPA